MWCLCVCLSCIPGATPYLYSFFGRGSGGIYLDRVSCSGNEQALINCSHRGIGVHSCTHSEDAGVMCLGKNTITAAELHY